MIELKLFKEAGKCCYEINHILLFINVFLLGPALKNICNEKNYSGLGIQAYTDSI